jgi:hypothetical protein
MPRKDPEQRKLYNASLPKEQRNRRDKQKKKEYNKLYESTRQYTREEKDRRNLGHKRRYQARRIKVLEHYSNGIIKCNCCGETTIEFMSIDHIGGGGNEHRKLVGRKGILNWIISNNYPEGFQVLCHNCNMAKGANGTCPHQRIITKGA